MKLKTYTADTMAQALAQVRKDLGKDAMILHTRSFRVGAWFGLGGKNMVEITASSPTIASRSKAPKPMPRVARPHAPNPQQTQQPELRTQPEPEIVIQRGSTVTRQRLAPEHAQVLASAQAAVQSQSQNQGQGRSTDEQLPRNRRSPSDDRGLNGRDALFGDDATPTRSTRNPERARPSRLADMQPQNAPVVPKQSIEAKPVAVPSPQVKPQVQPEVKPQAKPDAQPAAKTDGQTNTELRSQIDSLQKMMGQVLESTRKTAVAVGTGSTSDALPSGEMPAPLFTLYAKMIDNDVPVDLADALVGSVRDRLDAMELKDDQIVRQALLRAIESTIQCRSDSLLTIDHRSVGGRPRVIALVGPTGVGKTTTVAKLAATYKLRHAKKVGLITSDTYRIAAVEQLRTYAGIIGLPLKIANSPEEITKGIEELGDCDIVVIDTAGRSQNNTSRLQELAEFTKAANPDETHLVLSTTVGDNVLRKTAQSFAALGPDRCILTKLDEAVTTGPIAGLSDRIGLPLSFVTVGQEVPDDLEPARADRLARCVLDGPDAVVRRISEENG